MPKLVNITNHPSSKWTENQIESALKLINAPVREYIIDVAFPNIDPDIIDIEQVAKDFFAENIETKFSKDDIFHVMGESGFVFNLVYLMKINYFVKIVHSTTKRIAAMDENGNKISKFEFCQFRYY